MKKRLSKIVALAAAAVMALSLAACTTTNDTKGTAADATTAAVDATTAEGATEADDGTVYKIGICQLVQHVALDAASQGFQDALKELLGEDHVEFDYQDASGDSANCSTIINGFVSANVDLILANATAPLQAAASATDTIPVLGTSITDYGTALGIDDWTGVTGYNVSGTSDLAPLQEQAAMIKELFPDATNVGILYCSAEANSKYQADVMVHELEAIGIGSTIYTFTDTNDVATVTENACANESVLYIPTDNTAASNTGIIDQIAQPAGVPIVCGESGIAAGCGVAALSISYYDLGYATGKMAYDILVNDVDITTMAVQYAPNVTKMYNASICEALNITVPDDYVAIEE